MLEHGSFPESLSFSLLCDQDGLIGSLAIISFLEALENHLEGRDDPKEELERVWRFLRIITPKSILLPQNNIIECLNASRITIAVCHIYDHRRGFSLAEDDIKKLEAHKLRCQVTSATMAKIVEGGAALPNEIEYVENLLTDLHAVFWGMALDQRHKAGDDE
ncbi:MAG: hypothetical protein UT43_C0042G0007 [Parcubacteria group bacterium GW2011_GWC1_39_29]|nr:MAG: hypothetical protein UT43_C0042G0007 [Parcubacteria group bacterium GW2011_GWC1_39_29]